MHECLTLDILVTLIGNFVRILYSYRIKIPHFLLCIKLSVFILVFRSKIGAHYHTLNWNNTKQFASFTSWFTNLRNVLMDNCRLIFWAKKLYKLLCERYYFNKKFQILYFYFRFKLLLHLSRCFYFRYRWVV